VWTTIAWSSACDRLSREVTRVPRSCRIVALGSGRGACAAQDAFAVADLDDSFNDCSGAQPKLPARRMGRAGIEPGTSELKGSAVRVSRVRFG